MSLASLLLGGDSKSSEASLIQHVDNELDVLFRSKAAPIASHLPQRENVSGLMFTRGHKRKMQQGLSEVERESPSASPNINEPKTAKRKKSVVIPGSSSDGSSAIIEDHASLEDAYLLRRTVPADEEPANEYKPSSEDDEDAEPPQHETHTTKVSSGKQTKPRKKKYVPPDETLAQRDARTIFVGNITIDIAKSKSLQKQLKNHFISRVPGAKIESVRFRSVAFASATAPLPTENRKPQRNTMSKTQRRQSERTSTWRDTGDHASEDNGEHEQPKKPSFLTHAEKKRVAFFKGEFHKDVDTVNAYIVFAHPSPDDPPADALSPIEAARLAVAHCDGTMFRERTIRVDRTGKWRTGSEAEGAEESKGDPRATLFVGNLDFSAREEDLRIWFEGVVGQVRGPRAVVDASPDEAKWVQRVRIVRDRDTQLGKGFGYVCFVDRECVDEVLALERESLKFAKRTLRVQRCKVASPPSIMSVAKARLSTRAPRVQTAVHANPKLIPVPAGDPLLGEKLAGLSKEERKAAKAADVARLQRRLAKKRAQADATQELRGRHHKVRDRKRMKGGKSARTKQTANKGRLRDEKSVEKRNLKKIA